ncbi:probable acyl-activating enzyme 17 peroxisomal [Phtheirospermum japonicum]|uniref:Probable acyl-activating enzyme 17 peroxisomal n=1 Tax=Phtheirospermum japonicum TaxID=374723 RepID=A0A830BBR8_9LAMI|nr:probable acyl-activating enzyme 17 peroxisomal [Phtheirospermum japonicum]
MGSENYKSLDCITVADISALGIAHAKADEFHCQLAGIIQNWGSATPQTWSNISKHLLTPDLPFSFHQMMYYGCYKYFGVDPPAWLPDPDGANLTNVGKLLKEHGKELLGSKYIDPISSFRDFQEFSVSNPEVYWRILFEKMNVLFSAPPECILHEVPSHLGGQWLPCATTNPANNCLSVVKRTVEDIAVIWRDEADDELPVNKMSLKELRASVWLVAHAIETLNLEKGSAIAIDMPMNVNSVVIYLAIILAGYIVVSIADSFAPKEISSRLQISKAQAIFTQSPLKFNLHSQDLIIRGDKRLHLYRKHRSIKPSQHLRKAPLRLPNSTLNPQLPTKGPVTKISQTLTETELAGNRFWFLVLATEYVLQYEIPYS